MAAQYVNSPGTVPLMTSEDIQFYVKIKEVALHARETEKVAEGLKARRQAEAKKFQEIEPDFKRRYGARYEDILPSRHKSIREDVIRDVVWSQDEKASFKAAKKTKNPELLEMKAKLNRKVATFYKKFMEAIYPEHFKGLKQAKKEQEMAEMFGSDPDPDEELEMSADQDSPVAKRQRLDDTLKEYSLSDIQEALNKASNKEEFVKILGEKFA